MITDPIPTQDIRYNPASACFEAKVTVHGAGPACVYACELEGDLSLTTDTIEKELRAEALRRHGGRIGLRSSQRSSEPRPLHDVNAAPRAKNWLARLPVAQFLKAA